MQQQHTATHAPARACVQTRMRDMFDAYVAKVENKPLVSDRSRETESALQLIGDLAQEVLSDQAASEGDKYRIVQFVSDLRVAEKSGQSDALRNNTDAVSADPIIAGVVQRMRDAGIDMTDLDRAIASKSNWSNKSGRPPSSPRFSVQHLVA